MPPAIIPDNGKTGMAGALLTAIANGNNSAMVHLFTNNYTPVSSSVIVDFVEATAGGLGGQATPPAVDQGVVPGGQDNWVFGVIQWVPTGTGLPTVIYGYWVDFIDPATAAPAMLWAQRFDNPFACSSPADIVSFILNLAATQG